MANICTFTADIKFASAIGATLAAEYLNSRFNAAKTLDQGTVFGGDSVFEGSAYHMANSLTVVVDGWVKWTFTQELAASVVADLADKGWKPTFVGVEYIDDDAYLYGEYQFDGSTWKNAVLNVNNWPDKDNSLDPNELLFACREALANQTEQ